MAKKNPAKEAALPQKAKTKLTFSDFLGRFHAIIFTLTVGGGLTIAVLMISSALSNTTPPDDYTPSATSLSFDEQTIERLRALGGSESNTAQDSPELPLNEEQDQAIDNSTDFSQSPTETSPSQNLNN